MVGNSDMADQHLAIRKWLLGVSIQGKALMLCPVGSGANLENGVIIREDGVI